MNHARVSRWAAVLLVVAATFAVSGGASAQVARERDRLQRELEKTDEIIGRAREASQDAVSPRPHELVDRARQIEDDAWSAFHGGQFLRCAERTRAARDDALRALRLAEGEFRAVERIRELLERTQDLVDEAASAVPQSHNDQAERLLEAGRWQLGRAREAFRDRRFRQGLLLSLTSRDLLLKALRLVDVGPASKGGGVHDVIARTKALADEAASSAEGHPKARALVEEGNRLLDEARDAERAQKPDVAYQRALAARERFLDALQDEEPELKAPEVAAEVQATRRLLDIEAPRLAASGSAPILDLLDEARQRQSDAEEHLARGRLQPALTETKLAEALLRKALDLLGP